MTGACFINHLNGWSCTNMATISKRYTPVFEDDGRTIKHNVESEQVVLKTVFAGVNPLVKGETCHIVFKSDDDKIEKIALYGQVSSIQSENTFIKILSRMLDYSEILRNIEIKIKDNGKT